MSVAGSATGAKVPPWLLIAPLAMSGVAILFFPIQLAESGTGDLSHRKPSHANILVFVYNAWLQP